MSGNWRSLNRANWDERVPLHLGSALYDRAHLRARQGRLDAIAEAGLGDVAGLRIAHLQCHMGDDTLCLAQRGAAEVVGLDFSAPAIAAASCFAAELGLVQARFVQSDIHDAPAALGTGYDLVFTSWGAICWLPDIRAWARVIAQLLRPGGALFFAEAHPVALVFDDAAPADAQGRPGWDVPYFGGGPLEIHEFRDYADSEAVLSNSHTVQWLHSLSDILGALRDAGLRLEWLKEHPGCPWQMFRSLVRGPDGLWTWPDRAWLPLGISLRATRE
ncbi:class I SAM-dependent methyltransferase [Sediminicoccus sp. KRV36]|uniref:class I SAM-dependent methyltransferase n=1 Tax=Sediminicoccus sp. KRV36 TaxID=3133721 RepID=UPI00200FFBF1|nr:class I SAM-dependent methyltransferase [Sediminicoccus rosea]UPY37139.1 class I SAM-dependent methyltransferase [Sediminicoccus rosea]